MFSAKTEKSENTITSQPKDIEQSPGVTIGIPVLNEEDHIERVVSGFLKTEYPNLIEILIADGGSTDRTREIVQELSEKDSRVKLVDNPDKFQSFALNRMIEKAQGEIFLRADGHCLYQEDYLKKNIEVFLETGAKNVGGAQRYVAKNAIQAGTALAVKSFLGNGGAKYMDETYEGFADTVFLGCFWTKELREIGGFNTKNITNQDSELNLRLIETFGDSVYISPEIKSWYYPRASYSKLFKQYFRYGRGRFQTIILHPKNIPIRGLAPFLFYISLFAYGITDLISMNSYFFLEFFALLVIAILIESLRIVSAHNKKFKKEIWIGEEKKPGVNSLYLHTILSFIVMPFGHFSGFLYQLLRTILTKIFIFFYVIYYLQTLNLIGIGKKNITI